LPSTRRPTPKPSTRRPSAKPSNSEEPSDHPTQSEEPSEFPTQSEEPSENPTQSEEPSEFPTQSEEPSEFPTQSEEPSQNPTGDLTVAEILCLPQNNAVFGVFCCLLREAGLAEPLNNFDFLDPFFFGRQCQVFFDLLPQQIPGYRFPDGNLANINGNFINQNIPQIQLPNFGIPDIVQQNFIDPFIGGRTGVAENRTEGGAEEDESDEGDRRLVGEKHGEHDLAAAAHQDLEDQETLDAAAATMRDLQRGNNRNRDYYQYNENDNYYRDNRGNNRNREYYENTENYYRRYSEADLRTILNTVYSDRDNLEVWTVFAPTNRAFDRLDFDVIAWLRLNVNQQRSILRDLIEYHIVPGEAIPYRDLTCGRNILMANGINSRTECRGNDRKYQVGIGNRELDGNCRFIIPNRNPINRRCDVGCTQFNCGQAACRGCQYCANTCLATCTNAVNDAQCDALGSGCQGCDFCQNRNRCPQDCTRNQCPQFGDGYDYDDYNRCRNCDFCNNNIVCQNPQTFQAQPPLFLRQCANVGNGGYTCRNVRLGGQPLYRCVPPGGKRDLQVNPANLIYVPGTGNNGINQLRCLETYPEIIAPRNLVGSNGVVHALDDVMIPFFPDFPTPFVPVPVTPVRFPTPAPIFRPDTCMCTNTGCFGGVEMTYNRRRCDPATTRTTNPQANDYCEDLTTGVLPTGNVPAERLTVGFYYCDGSPNTVNPSPDDQFLLGYRNMITDQQSFDLNVRNVQTTIPPTAPQVVPTQFGGRLDVCLPDCIQVRVFSYDSNSAANPVVYTLLQQFNIDTRCAGNTLVTRTNYGAFYYRDDFNVQCPVGKK
jgi:uncharacterized surface protein with fasciclin (FAS1) repeats